CCCCRSQWLALAGIKVPSSTTARDSGARDGGSRLLVCQSAAASDLVGSTARKRSRRRFLHLAAGAAALPMAARVAHAQAQDYPNKTVRIITHSAPGGAPDA